jgi:hypothetical protein
VLRDVAFTRQALKSRDHSHTPVIVLCLSYLVYCINALTRVVIETSQESSSYCDVSFSSLALTANRSPRLQRAKPSNLRSRSFHLPWLLILASSPCRRRIKSTVLRTLRKARVGNAVNGETRNRFRHLQKTSRHDHATEIRRHPQRKKSFF